MEPLRKSFLMLAEWESTIDRLSDEQVGKLLRILYDYELRGIVPDTIDDPLIDMAFCCTMRHTIDTLNTSYDNKVKAGRSGGQAKANNKKKSNQYKQDSSNGVADSSNGVADPSNGVADPSNGVADSSNGVADSSNGVAIDKDIDKDIDSNAADAHAPTQKQSPDTTSRVASEWAALAGPADPETEKKLMQLVDECGRDSTIKAIAKAATVQDLHSPLAYVSKTARGIANGMDFAMLKPKCSNDVAGTAERALKLIQGGGDIFGNQ